MNGTGGRPRDQGKDDAVLVATRQLLAEGGYAAATIPAVARRAAVGAPTIYRRWRTQADLVSVAIATPPALVAKDFIGAVRALLTILGAWHADAVTRTALSGLFGAQQHEAARCRAILSERYQALREAFDGYYQAARAGQEIGPVVAADTLFDMLAGLALYRGVVDHPLTAQAIDEVVAVVTATPRGREDGPDAGSEPPRSNRSPDAIVEWSGGTRERILSAARECIGTVGLRRTSMGSIARRARVSRAGLYRYYPNKQALVDEVLVRNGNLVRTELARQLDGAPDLAAKVAIAARFGRFLPEDLHLLRLNETDPEALALLLTTGAGPFLERATRFWTPHIDAAIAAGELEPTLDRVQAAEWVARSLFALSTTPPPTLTGADGQAIGDYARTFIVGGLTPGFASPRGR